MFGKVTMTYKQLEAVVRIHEDIRKRGFNYVRHIPGYSWLENLLAQPEVEDYWATGFRGDHLIDFHWWRYKPVGVIDFMQWTKDFIIYHWIDWKFKLSLIVFGTKRDIPTPDALYEKYIMWMEDETYNPFDEDHICVLCGNVGCAHCDANIRGFEYDIV